MVLKYFHILLVEDDPTDSLFVIRAVGEKPYQSLQAVEDGVQALNYLYRLGTYVDAPRPDLILLDIKLPQQDGSAVLREMRADASLKSIPVIILTSANTEEQCFRQYAGCANGYLRKFSRSRF